MWAGLAIAVGLAVGLAVWLFLPIGALRVHQYLDDPRYSHCLLIPFVSALYIYDRWDRLRGIERRGSTAGLTCLVAGVALYVYARWLHTNIWQHIGLLVALTGGVWAVLGRTWVRSLAFPLGYLLLTVPLPKTWDDRLTQPLQRIATIVAEEAFKLLDWPVLRMGNVLQLPGLKLLVEEQCSGAHSLYALGALAFAWVAFMPRPWWLRIVLVLSAGPVAVVANTVRVTLTGVLAYKVDTSYATGISHSTAGMVVFGIGLALFLLIDWCLKPDEFVDEVDDDRSSEA